ncbi:tetratricopeptide repeat protein [soil metagenome]
MARKVQPAPPDRRGLVAALCVLLVVLTLMVFGQTLRHDFVNYDDPEYVYEHPKITAGLSVAGVPWAFTNVHARNWHPLTTISHMLDCQLYGLKAGAHHLTNVLLHAGTAVLLFLVLRGMTEALWRSAFVAAVFAIHPLRVESVAWISERKDVLSGLFFVLTLGAYLRYTQQRSAARYAVLLVAFACGLLAKPMLVTVPFLLLLLDFWPLPRLGRDRKILPLLLEKLPLVALAAAASIITMLVQKTGGAMREAMPLSWRIGNAFVSCVAYVRDTFWPTNLAPFYPHPENQLPMWQIALAVLVVLGITAAAVVRWRRSPYLVSGWFWFLGMLVPVIGMVEVGSQARADRYTYLPQIGLLICLTWGVSELLRPWRYRAQVTSALGAAAILALAVAAWRQSLHWRDSETLWTHTFRVTSDNHVAHNNMADLHFRRGEIEEELRHYEQALAIRSRSYIARYDFLLALYHTNYGSALQRLGRVEEALPHYEKAIALQPDFPAASRNYGGALVESGRVEEGIALLRKVLELEPKNAEARSDLGTALLRSGDDQAAIAQYEQALAIEPRIIAPLNNLSWLYATSPVPAVRNGARALALAERAMQVMPGEDPLFLHKLAAACAANGDFPRAIAVAERALELASRTGHAGLPEELQRNLASYRAGTPLTDLRR